MGWQRTPYTSRYHDESGKAGDASSNPKIRPPVAHQQDARLFFACANFFFAFFLASGVLALFSAFFAFFNWL